MIFEPHLQEDTGYGVDLDRFPGPTFRKSPSKSPNTSYLTSLQKNAKFLS